MASINYATRQISVKIVYYGPGLSGKTTNLQVIHKKTPQEHKSDMVSLATETDRTLFFDFLPLDLGKIKGFATKFQLYTVPGQVYYNATRKLVLRGVDGVVFVADSGADKVQENLESFQNLEDNLAEYGYQRESVPIILQYNKRDLPNALAIDELNRLINKYNLPWGEGIAYKGVGVFDTLKQIGKIVIDYLNKKYSRSAPGARGGEAAAPRAPAPAAPGYQPQQSFAPPPAAQQPWGAPPPAQQQWAPPPQQSFQPQQQPGTGAFPAYQPPPQQQPFAPPPAPSYDSFEMAPPPAPAYDSFEMAPPPVQQPWAPPPQSFQPQQQPGTGAFPAYQPPPPPPPPAPAQQPWAPPPQSFQPQQQPGTGAFPAYQPPPPPPAPPPGQMNYDDMFLVGPSAPPPPPPPPPAPGGYPPQGANQGGYEESPFFNGMAPTPTPSPVRQPSAGAKSGGAGAPNIAAPAQQPFSDVDLEIEKYQNAIEAPPPMPSAAPPQGMFQAQAMTPPPPSQAQPSFQVESSYASGYDEMATPGNSAIFEFEEELFASLKGKKP